MATWKHIEAALNMRKVAARNKNVQAFTKRMNTEARGSAVFARFRPGSLRGTADLQVDITSTSVV